MQGPTYTHAHTHASARTHTHTHTLTHRHIYTGRHECTQAPHARAHNSFPLAPQFSLHELRVVGFARCAIEVRPLWISWRKGVARARTPHQRSSSLTSPPVIAIAAFACQWVGSLQLQTSDQHRCMSGRLHSHPPSDFDR